MDSYLAWAFILMGLGLVVSIVGAAIFAINKMVQAINVMNDRRGNKDD